MTDAKFEDFLLLNIRSRFCSFHLVKMYGLPSGITPATVFLSHSQPIHIQILQYRILLHHVMGTVVRHLILYAGDFSTGTPDLPESASCHTLLYQGDKLVGRITIHRAAFQLIQRTGNRLRPIIWLVGVTNGGKPASIRTLRNE